MDQPLTRFPQKRIRPYDGMAITAEIWDAAHSYHRQAAQSHHLLFHGAGILTGLEVIAGDPPGSIVYVLPGAAVDAQGRVIVLAEPVAYDLGSEVDGPLYLHIAYRESAPALDDGSQGEPVYIQEQFLITARSTPPQEGVSVELARFTRSARGAAITDAADPDHPRKNEIDLRYRQAIHAHLEQPLTAAVIYLGEVKEKIQGRGLARMGREVRHYSDFHLIVEDDQPLDPSVLSFSFLYLVGAGSFKFSASQVKGLQGYLEHGGTLIGDAQDPAAQDSLCDLAGQLGVSLAPLGTDDPLLSEPFCFSAPPPALREAGSILAGDGFLLSGAGYGAYWAGKAAAPRAELRASMEWGANLLSAVVERHSRA